MIVMRYALLAAMVIGTEIARWTGVVAVETVLGPDEATVRPCDRSARPSRDRAAAGSARRVR